MSSIHEPIVVGTFGATYGIKGWIRINSFTDSMEGIFDYQPWLVNQNGTWQKVSVVDWRLHGKTYIVSLEGVSQREEAKVFVNQEIAIFPEQLQELPSDEYYWRELVRCEVINHQGYHMGEVVEILETGSNDVLRVKANSRDAFGKQERLIPFIESDFILDVNIAAKQIKVNWEPDF